MQSSSEVVKMRADSGTTPKESMTNRRQTVGSEPTGAPKNKWARFGVLAAAVVLLASVALGQAPSGRRPHISSNAVPGEPMSYSLYTPELNLMSQTTPSTASNPPIAHEYIWFGGQPVAQIDAATNTPRSTFTDHLGTPILQTDTTGAVIWRAEYDPYGDVREVRVGTSADQPLRLPGQEAAMTSGGNEENYNIFRWYRSGWGQYTQPDPLGLEADLNLFRYVGNAPTTTVDPLGLYRRGDVIYRCPPAGTAGNCDVTFVWDDPTPDDNTDHNEIIIAFGPPAQCHQCTQGLPPILTQRDAGADPYRGYETRGVYVPSERRNDYEQRRAAWNQRWSFNDPQCYNLANYMSGFIPRDYDPVLRWPNIVEFQYRDLRWWRLHAGH
jgi:RHS repeat-associated protein